MKNPKIMFNKGTNKFEALEPEDDKLFESIMDKYKKNPVKPFNNYDKSTYPSNPKQREAMSTWEMLKEDAKEERKRGNYGPTRELKEIETRHNLNMQKQRYEDFKRKQREKNKKKPVADNFNVDTTAINKKITDYKKEKGTLEGIFREPLKQDTMYGEPETWNMTVDEFIKQKAIDVKPQEYGIGSMERPNETTKTAYQLLQMMRKDNA